MPTSPRRACLSIVALTLPVLLGAQEPSSSQPPRFYLSVRPLSQETPIRHPAEVYLLPSAEEVIVTAEEIPSDHPVETGQFASAFAEGEVTLTQTITRRFTWNISSGGATPLRAGQIRWSPALGGKLSAIRVQIEQDLQAQGSGSSSGSRFAEKTAQVTGAQIRLLPGVSFDRNGDGTLEGATLGVYPNELGDNVPAPVKRNPESYRPPTVLYRLDSETKNLKISPSATLGSLNPEVFADGEARYVALNPKVITFWEELAKVTEEKGKSPSGLLVLRGYVSPSERQRLERLGVSLAVFTRFQYGDALAIIYDRNNDFRMDDLNGDLKVDVEDARVLAEWVELAQGRAKTPGGIGISASFEGPNHIGTPFVHADVRGWALKWEE